MQKAYIFLKTAFSLVANKTIYATLLPFSVRIISLGVFLHTVRFLAIEFSAARKKLSTLQTRGPLGKITAIPRLSDMMQVVIHNGGHDFKVRALAAKGASNKQLMFWWVFLVFVFYCLPEEEPFLSFTVIYQTSTKNHV